MASMKEFLNTYCSRMIFREMSHEQFVQFCGYIKDKKATDNQKIWAKEFLKTNPVTGEYLTVPGTNIYIPKDMPDPKDPADEFFLEDKEWIKLFKAFRDAFQAMHSNKKDFKYNDDATGFLKQYFNPSAPGTTLFQPEQIKPSAKNKIYNATNPNAKSLYKFLNDNKSTLKSKLSAGYYSILTEDFTYEELLSGLKPDSAGNTKYDTDPSFRKKMLNVVEYIQGTKTELATNSGIDITTFPDLSDYEDWFDSNSVSPIKLNQFKNELLGLAAPERSGLLQTLREKSKIRDVFSKYDGGKISGPLNKAISELSYNNPKSEDYVLPKRSDELSFRETIAEWWGDTYSDVLEKYVKLKGDELFFSPEAKIICKHLSKDLKKTDNLDAVLKNISKTKEKLTASREFDAIKHLDWFEKTLNEMKADPKIEKIWSGALQHGGKLQALVREIIIKAVKENKIKEAETTLELLSVLHFGFTTSKIMDTLKDTEFTLMSDKDLSWNKNKATQLITKALDKSVKWALMGVGYGITMAKNAYSLSKTKIRSYSDKTGRLRAAHDQHLQSNNDERTTLQNTRNANIRHRNYLQHHTNNILAGRSYDVAKNDIENDITNDETVINNVLNAIEELRSALNKHITVAPNPDIVDADELSNFLDNADNALSQDPVGALPAYAPGMVNGALLAPLDTITVNWGHIQTLRVNIKRNKRKLDYLIDGTETVNQLNTLIAKQENEILHWDENHTDKMKHLIEHWNMLETGRNTKTGPMYNWFSRLSKKKAQDDLNANKAAIIAQYRASHSIAA